MNPLATFIASHKIVAGALVAGVVVTGGVAVAAQDAEAPTTATVSHIVDGDTLDVRYAGGVHRIRLLNVDTPESVKPGAPVECLAPEASGFLEATVPPGTEVALEFDVEKFDPYGRELAGVFVDTTLVNAEIARAGLGVAVLYEPNDKFYDEVLSAQKEARTNGSGLYSEAVACTVPAQLRQFADTVAAATASAPAEGVGVAALDQHVSDLAAATMAGVGIAQVLDGDRSALPLAAFTAMQLSLMRTQFEQIQTRADTALSHAKTTRDAEKSRLEAERLAREEAERLARVEADRLAREAEERRVAEEAQEAAEKAQREAEAARLAEEAEQAATLRAAEEQRARAGSPTTAAPPPSSTSGGYDGYTGCRAYGGGYAPNAVDEQGRPYTKIDCVSKTPIG